MGVLLLPVYFQYIYGDVSLSVAQLSKSPGGLLGTQTILCYINTAVTRTKHVFHAGKTVPHPRHNSNASTPKPWPYEKKAKHSIVVLHWILTYLLKLIGFGLVLIPVCVLSVGHAKPPYCKDAIDIVPYPRILMVRTSWKQPCNWVLNTVEKVKNKHYYLKSHLLW